MVKIIRMP